MYAIGRDAKEKSARLDFASKINMCNLLCACYDSGITDD